MSGEMRRGTGDRDHHLDLLADALIDAADQPGATAAPE
jgi:hypothetical protein